MISREEKRKGKERKGKDRKGKDRKGKERKGKERKGKERKGKERASVLCSTVRSGGEQGRDMQCSVTAPSGMRVSDHFMTHTHVVDART